MVCQILFTKMERLKSKKMFEGFPDDDYYNTCNYDNGEPPPENPEWIEVLVFLAVVAGFGLVVYNFFIGGFS